MELLKFLHKIIITPIGNKHTYYNNNSSEIVTKNSSDYMYTQV